ncbi:MAG: hypothetical protein VYA67_13950 [Actinomycetota bacterium]|uniref:Transmembrane protein n=1 Tax=Mycobacterium lentiflavum TaxID=141349 RepID=A0ABY3UQX9_MYCLN|nr:hypothetical protein [Mycobacterium lentiflavum]MEE3065036.1 hypothetical protein [Actinomycetota bacterium]ULP41122.1 hypothetical protein MJO58_19795 [Mycobacterium lentiflavum]
MKSTIRAVVHRLKQARSALLKVEAAWAGTQFLLGLGPLGVLIALVLWARRRRNNNEPAQPDTRAPNATDAEVEADGNVPVTAASAAAGDGLAH